MYVVWFGANKVIRILYVRMASYPVVLFCLRKVKDDPRLFVLSQFHLIV
jgi:Na+/serine symporter